MHCVSVKCWWSQLSGCSTVGKWRVFSAGLRPAKPEHQCAIVLGWETWYIAFDKSSMATISWQMWNRNQEYWRRTCQTNWDLPTLRCIEATKQLFIHSHYTLWRDKVVLSLLHCQVASHYFCMCWSSNFNQFDLTYHRKPALRLRYLLLITGLVVRSRADVSFLNCWRIDIHRQERYIWNANGRSVVFANRQEIWNHWNAASMPELKILIWPFLSWQHRRRTEEYDPRLCEPIHPSIMDLEFCNSNRN